MAVTLSDVQTKVEGIYEKMMTCAEINRSLIESGRTEAPNVVDVDSVERSLFEELLSVGRLLMRAFIEDSGTGDVGVTTEFDGREYKRHTSLSSREYHTVFGALRYNFQKYFCVDPEIEAHYSPKRSVLNFPERKASYFMQDLLCRLAVDRPFEESCEFFADIFGTSVSKRTVDDNMMEQATHAQSFTEKSNSRDTDVGGDLLVVSFDAKGVPMHKESRLSDGTKRMAMIGVDYEVNRHHRSAEEVVAGLICGVFPEIELVEETKRKEEVVVPRAVNKHYQAELEDKDVVFENIRLSALRRRKEGQPMIALVDGAPELRNRVNHHFPEADAHILDIVHPLGYLGESMSSLHEKEEQKKAALQQHLLALLTSGECAARAIVEQLEAELNSSERKFKKGDRDKIQSTITYFKNNYDRMRYDVYLAKGYPIATGVIESACGMLVCDRMEFAGARWQLKPADATLAMRSVKKSGDWHAYQAHRKEQEYMRLYAKAS